jgi:YHS domain-containing protein
MIKLLAIIAFFILLYYVARSLFSPQKPKPKKPVMGADGKAVNDVMVQDPACGVYLPKGDAIRAKIDGEIHYFCSDACMQRFKEGITHSSDRSS